MGHNFGQSACTMCTVRLKCAYSEHSGHKGMERSKQLIPQLMKLFVQYWRCRGADASGGSRGCFGLWGAVRGTRGMLGHGPGHL